MSQAIRTQVTLVANETQAANEAFSGKRSRPVMAMAGDQIIVCCKKTARKHGWTIVGKMYAKVRAQAAH